MPTIKQFEALRWIAALGSYEKAAERLNATQSTISKRIQDLEAAIGASLFDRHRRSVRLTSKGETILALAEDILRLRDQVVAIGTNRAAAIRHLRFGVTELTALTWLPRFVAEIRGAYPNIMLEPEVEQSVDLFQRLKVGGLDFIIVPNSIWQPGYTSVPLASVRNAWMCSPNLIKTRDIIPLEALSDFNILTQGNRSGSGIIFNRWLDECGMRFPKLISSNSVVALIGLTIAEIGISYMPPKCFEALLHNGTLRVIETDPGLPQIDYILMFRGDESTAVVDAISQIARDACEFGRPIRWA